MASNTSQPEHLNKLKKNIAKIEGNPEQQKDLLSEPLDSDIDFWNIDSDDESTDQFSDELEDFLSSPATPTSGEMKPLSQLVEQPDKRNNVDAKSIINQLEQANSNSSEATGSTLSEQDIEDYQNQEAKEQEKANNQLRNKKNSQQKRTLLEKIFTALSIVFLIGLAVSFYHYSGDRFDIKTEEKWVTNIPVTGQYADIASVETWWAEPVKKAKLGVKLVPTVKITLENNSKSGAIRVIFFSYEEGLNGNKKPKGDQVPLTFKDGRFENGASSIIVQCTDGFSSIAEFNSYRGQQIIPKEANQSEERWTIKIKEAPSIDTAAADYLELGHAPIDPTRDELSSEKTP